MPNQDWTSAGNFMLDIEADDYANIITAGGSLTLGPGHSATLGSVLSITKSVYLATRGSSHRETLAEYLRRPENRGYEFQLTLEHVGKWPDSTPSLSKTLTHDDVPIFTIGPGVATARATFFESPLDIPTDPTSVMGLMVSPVMGGTAVPGPDLLRFGTFQMTMKIERRGGTW